MICVERLTLNRPTLTKNNLWYFNDTRVTEDLCLCFVFECGFNYKLILSLRYIESALELSIVMTHLPVMCHLFSSSETPIILPAL